MVSGTDTKTDGAAATPAQTSGGSTGTTPEVFTEVQVKKRVSDELAKVGRDAKTLETQRTKLEADRTAIETQRSNWKREREAAEEAAVRDDPDAFKSLEARRAIARKEEENQRQATENATEKERLADLARELGSTTSSTLAIRVATELGVNAETLLKFASTEDEMRELAQELPKSGSLPPFKPDSGRGAGIGSATLEQLSKVDTRKMTINQLREHGEKLDEALRTTR